MATIVDGRDKVRLRPWRSSIDTAAVIPITSGRPLRSEAIRRSVDSLRSHGITRAITAALSPADAEPFLTAGFRVNHELHLLSITPADAALGPPDHRRLRSARRLDWPSVIEIDQSAFDWFWQFDQRAIRDALQATPSRRFQVVRGQPIAGYHITGRSHHEGFLQRLAVRGDAQGQGFGRLLLADSLDWLRRRNVHRCWVNTQLDNERAYELYRSAGFQPAAYRLAVLEADLSDVSI